MNGRKLQDRLYLGMGLSAKYIGQSTDTFRPAGPHKPLQKINRFMRLPAAFISAQGGENRANSYGDPLWHGIFDASYTRTGDYLVAPSGTFFVISQDPLLPVLCVRVNRMITVSRVTLQSGAALNAYGGYVAGRSSALLTEWPASVFREAKSGPAAAGLPADQSVPYWTVLLPPTPTVSLAGGDIIVDDLGQTAIIAVPEITNLGWRISAKMATI